MGVMKRLDGWITAGWPVPRPLQVLAGLVPPRPTAEELAEARAAAREARAEREAIQWEAALSAAPPATAPAPPPPAPVRRPEIVEEVESAAAVGSALPAGAAAGWYRLGQTFYRVGSGPCPGFARPAASRGPVRREQQMTLF